MRNPPTDKLTNGLLLGWEKAEGKKRNPVWDFSREGHLITIAPTGAGKGVSCVIPALLSWAGPAIVIDPKGENYAVTAERRKALGHLVYKLDPFRVTGDGPSDSLNPMDLIDPSADDFEDNAAVVANLCMQEKTNTQDSFWDERASTMIEKVICELFRVMPDQQPTLQDVQRTLTGVPIHDNLGQRQFMEIFNDKAPKPKPVEKPKTIDLSQLITSAEFSSDKTRSSIMATAMGHMGFLKSPTVHASISNSTITLDDITAGAMATIYLILPAEKLVTHGKLLRLWLGVMLAAIARRKKAPPQPTLILIDEAAQLGYMAELKSALTLMRSYGVRVWTFWQDLSQLQQIYPRDWLSIINNSKVQQYFGAKSPPAKKSLELFLGDAWRADLTSDGQIVFDGEYLKVMQRPDYRSDPIFKGLAGQHPFHNAQDELALRWNVRR